MSPELPVNNIVSHKHQHHSGGKNNEKPEKPGWTMKTTLLFLLVCGLFIYLLWLKARLDKEIKRNRMHQAFTAGIIRTITDYHSKTDSIENNVPERPTKLPIPYQAILENIDWELSKDLLMANYEKWLKEDRNIFYDEKKYGDDGFNFMYLDLFDKKIKQWNSKS
jgi:hypothetical protein